MIAPFLDYLEHLFATFCMDDKLNSGHEGVSLTLHIDDEG